MPILYWVWKMNGMVGMTVIFLVKMIIGSIWIMVMMFQMNIVNVAMKTILLMKFVKMMMKMMMGQTY